jgi:ElaB/YqjD/DUF883 family membrane-anchored ribosome-binding protein
MNTTRTSEELETLKSDLRALRSDLRDVARDVGELTTVAARTLRERAPVGDWLQRATGVDLNSRSGREEALASLRGQGERSAAALRSTVQDHPMGAALGALAVGLAVAWFLTRSSHTR